MKLDLVSIDELEIEDLNEGAIAGASTASSGSTVSSAGTCAGTLSTVGSASK